MNGDDVTLKELQDRLLAHFDSLAGARKRSGFPIFALEHGLDPEELKRLNQLIRTRTPAASHWLLWAVYASEAGYGYNGEEYWPSFENQTPKWQYHDRPKLKSWLGKFQKSFNGVVPSGPWADQFSIISWPITHALLPRYLQRQFARLLYVLRFRLATDSSLDTGSIGRLFAVHASHASTRFQAFLQQEELTGQIVAALLGGEPVDAEDLIHPPTLERIVEDLERVRSSREWLKETRNVVSDRFKGIGRWPHPVSRGTTGRPLETSHLIIRPDLFLRHCGAANWTVLLKLKSFSPVAAASTELRAFLGRTRCRLNGASDWKPTGWLLSGNRMGALRRWPDGDTPLIHFERNNSLMDHLLESECRLAPGPWLFRIGSDGIAHHIASRTVRPGSDYVVVGVESMPPELPGSARCAIECDGVRAWRLAVPTQVPADVTARLRELQLDVARTIQVWPAGLPGRGWDGEGSTEWLTTESPYFGIAPDHALDALSLKLNDEPGQIVTIDPQNRSTFVRLPPLPAGIHRLTVEAHRSPDLDAAVSTPPAKGFIRLAVREPEPWVPGVASHPGLIVTTDPYDSSLDVLWRNELRLSVNGPQGFAVSFGVKLHTADGRQILSERIGDSMALPITPDAWRSAFAHFLDDEDRVWKYLEAASCTLEIDGDSLGRCPLTFEHDPSPLRWAFRRRRREILARLIDDSGQHDTFQDVAFYSMERPLDSMPLDVEAVRNDWIVAPPGGLFLARHPPFEDAAVVSALPRRAGFQDLVVDPHVVVPAGAPALLDAFLLLRLWHGARQAGFLAGAWQRQVTCGIMDGIFRTMCGKNWARAEQTFGENPTSRLAREALEARVERHTGFGRHLSQMVAASDHSEAAVFASFTAESGRHEVSHDPELCQFALRLASRQADALSDPDFEVRVSQLADTPALLRGARLVSVLRQSSRAWSDIDPLPNTRT